MMLFESSELKKRFEQYLEQWLKKPQDFYSKRLEESLRYGLKSPGKRLRPLLVMAMALDLKKDANAIKLSLPAALAVELVHTYSLIHDDLPAMDNDDFRRGRLSMHRRFDEGLAILAGDTLLSEAFIEAASSKYNALSITQVLAKACGRSGLVAGQAEDLKTDTFKDWLRINEAKTARLFQASSLMGALAVAQPSQQAEDLGYHFGMAFQIKDDLDDAQGLALSQDYAEVAQVKQFHIERVKSLSFGPHVVEILEKTFA